MKSTQTSGLVCLCKYLVYLASDPVNKMNHVSMYSGRGLFVKSVVLYSWEVFISHSCTQYMCWLIIKKRYICDFDRKHIRRCYMGGTRTRKDKACMLVAAADEICKSRDSKIKNIFLNRPLRSKQ